MWTYKATIDRVVDGDTVDAVIDLGFSISHKVRLRLARVDAPEMITIEGKRVKSLLENVLRKGQQCQVVTGKGDRYGRWIAEVTVGTVNVSDWLLDSGLAVQYVGG